MPLVPPYIEGLRPYEAGRTAESVRRQYGLSRVAKLASNENPLGTSPRALEAMHGSLESLNVYPNGGLDLREVLAHRFKLKVDNVIAGSGSEKLQSRDSNGAGAIVKLDGPSSSLHRRVEALQARAERR